MVFYIYLNVLIFSLFLILNIFTAQADALKLSVSHDGTSCINGTSCAIVAQYDKHIALKCTADSLDNQTLEWFKETSVVAQNDRIKIYRSENNIILNITSVLVDDHGDYYCQVSSKGGTVSNSSEKSSAINILVLPYVKNAHKDVTVIEENTLNLTCIVSSARPVNITWNVSTPDVNKTYTNSGDRISLEHLNDTRNAVLLVHKVNITKDRGTYTCLARSAVGESLTNSTYFVRVKSKYAAIWPFLGICIEVIILCTIILIYEKKRDKTELEESDTDQGPETKSSPDHGQDSVRYRK